MRAVTATTFWMRSGEAGGFRTPAGCRAIACDALSASRIGCCYAT
jgi:hypothetical protein